MRLNDFTLDQVIDIINGLKDNRDNLKITMIKRRRLNNDLIADEWDKWIRERVEVDYWEVRKMMEELRKLLSQLATVEIERGEQEK